MGLGGESPAIMVGASIVRFAVRTHVNVCP